MFSYSLPSPPPKHIEKVISPFLRALQFNVMHNIALVSLSSTQHTGFRSVVCSWLVFPSYCSCCNGSYAPEAKWRNRVIFKYISRFNQFSSLSQFKCSYFFSLVMYACDEYVYMWMMKWSHENESLCNSHSPTHLYHTLHIHVTRLTRHGGVNDCLWGYVSVIK